MSNVDILETFVLVVSCLAGNRNPDWCILELDLSLNWEFRPLVDTMSELSAFPPFREALLPLILILACVFFMISMGF